MSNPTVVGVAVGGDKDLLTSIAIEKARTIIRNAGGEPGAIVDAETRYDALVDWGGEIIDVKEEGLIAVRVEMEAVMPDE